MESTQENTKDWRKSQADSTLNWDKIFRQRKACLRTYFPLKWSFKGWRKNPEIVAGNCPEYLNMHLLVGYFLCFHPPSFFLVFFTSMLSSSQLSAWSINLWHLFVLFTVPGCICRKAPEKFNCFALEILSVPQGPALPWPQEPPWDWSALSWALWIWIFLLFHRSRNWEPKEEARLSVSLSLSPSRVSQKRSAGPQPTLKSSLTLVWLNGSVPVRKENSPPEM